MSAHTPGPWVAGRSKRGRVPVMSESVGIVADVFAVGATLHTGGANAARIVQCVNAHDDLLAALHNIAWLVDGREDIDNNGNANTYMLIGTAARAAIEKATP